MSKRVLILGIDGYLGWTLALWLGARGYKVLGVDNFHRRKSVEEVGADSVVPIAPMDERLRVAREVLGIEIAFEEIDILMDTPCFGKFLAEVQPDAIVHYAESPSAPYSMIDARHATYVQQNNVLGTLQLLFLMRDICPDAVLLKLGTMGEYGTPMGGRPIFEGFFPEGSELRWQGESWDISGELTSRDPGSFYHASKVQDSINVRCACKWWGLRSYDIMQGVVYGVHTDEMVVDKLAPTSRLRTRLDIDEYFGTVVNRHVAQAVIGLPLTVFGKGGQTRGLIALEDAMRCMELLIEHPLERGEYSVVNQLSGFHSVLELAKIVATVGRDEFGLEVQVGAVENPRVEAEQHPYDPEWGKLMELGFTPEVTLYSGIKQMFELMMQDEVRERIETQRGSILPETWWDGKKRRVEWLSS